jgi:hypothetical protein
MKLQKTILLMLILASFFQCSILAQNRCPEKIIYKTLSIGDGTSSIFAPLQFNFENDTLKMFPDGSNIAMVVFKIQEKSCTWNTENTEGQSIYKLLLVKNELEKATLTVSIKNKKGQIILQYTNKEARIFEMQKNTSDMENNQ